jgi:hypothetical protein
LFASNISSTTMIGLAGAAYTWGIAVANYEWMAAPILVVLALFLVPLTVWDPPSSGPSAFRFPGYVPSTEGDISWTAEVFDDDPDDDVATATTDVMGGR